MRLVTYSWLTVVIAVACAAIGWLGLAGWMAMVVVLASIAMHVAGNAIGTRMREAADRERPARPHGGGSLSAPLPLSSPTLLERHDRLGRLVPISAGIGATLGGLTGTIMLTFLTRSSLAGAVLGGASSAVIGGLFGFLMASFVEILRVSLRDAIAAERPSAPSELPGHQ